MICSCKKSRRTAIKLYACFFYQYLCEYIYNKNELDCKPGYVESDHLSRSYVAIKLKRPTWNAAGHCIIPQAFRRKLYLVLLRMGFTEPVMLP